MPKRKDDFYARVKKVSTFSGELIGTWFAGVDVGNVAAIGTSLAKYLELNLSVSVKSKTGLSGYRTNPFVNLTAAKTMALEEPDRFAEFLFNSKLYAGLETSFGKSLENELLAFYPNPNEHWIEPVEKASELEATSKLERVARARRRDIAVWREIDKSLVVGKKRYLLMIKSGPNTINDTQVAAMKDAIAAHHGTWLDESRSRYHVAELDIVIGIMYGTDWTTNNKENQILVKLMEHGFREDDGKVPGILVSTSHPGVRVYRRIGREFWALVGNPLAPEKAQHTFLEIMMGVIAALKGARKGSSIEALVKAKVVELASALNRIANSFSTFPKWVKDSYTPAELHWLIVALSSFFDEGI